VEAAKDAGAWYWYGAAAERGDAVAQINLGRCYEYGSSVLKDEAKAAEWYAKAAEQGIATAQNNLGLCYANGRGVLKDEAKAAEWYAKAAAQGMATAQNNLGLCYANGRGVLKDEAKAAEWYAKAAEQGNAAANQALLLLFKSSSLLLALLRSKSKVLALELLRRSSPSVVNRNVLLAAVEFDDAEVLSLVCELADVELNIAVEGGDLLQFAETNSYTESASVLHGLRLEKSARILVVGAAASGKTRLRKMMQQRGYVEGSTDLLEIDRDWTVGGVRLVVWDFAGQAGYYAAQQFFLGGRSAGVGLYFVVVVVDVRKSASAVISELDVWLGNACRNATRKVCVAFVGTHADKATADHARSTRAAVDKVVGRYSNAVECVKCPAGGVLWESGLSAKTADDLVGAVVKRCAEEPSRLAGRALHRTLAEVRRLARETHIAFLSDAEAPLEETHLVQLHDMAEIFYQSGALVASTDAEAPLSIFKALLRVCHRSLGQTACEVKWGLVYSAADVLVEDNELVLAWKNKKCHERLPLRRCKIDIMDGRVVKLAFACGVCRSFRFSLDSTAAEFVSVVNANSMNEVLDCKYTVSDEVLVRELHRLGFSDPASQELAQGMLLSNRVLVRGRPNEYLVPFLFPEKCGDLDALGWDRDGFGRHGRKYLFRQQGIGEQWVAKLVLELGGLMRGAQICEQHWRGQASIGACHRTENLSAYYECIFEPSHEWVLYVMVSGRSEKSLGKMVVRAHNTVASYVGSLQYSLFVALDASAVHPCVPSRDWAFRMDREVEGSLVPERMQGGQNLFKKGLEGVWCLWCAAKADHCTHPLLWRGLSLRDSSEAVVRGACCAAVRWMAEPEEIVHSKSRARMCAPGSARRWGA
jgi:hypothetical protein